MALVGTSTPAKGGLGYTPRAKRQNQRRKPGTLVGSAKPGKPGVGAALKPRFGKPAFKTGPAAKPKPAVAPRVAQSAAPDSAYNDAVDLAGRKEEQRLGALDTQEAAVKREFGIEDPTDPFSRANALKSAFLSREKAASAGLASQGQLYSGAHERALSRVRRESEEARHNLRNAYEAAIGQIGAEKAGVKFATEEERAQAFEDWLARAPEADEPAADIEAEADKPEAPVAPAAAAKPAGSDGPVLIASHAQDTTVKQTAEQAKRQARQDRRAAAIKAARQRKQGDKDAKGPGKAPIASINRPGQPKPKARPKPRPKAKPRRR